MFANKGLASLNYMDIEQILDRKAAYNKRGTLTMGEIKLLVQEIHDRREEGKWDLGTRDREMAAMQKKIKRYNVLDIDKWLGVFSFTVKLVSKIMVAF